MSDVTHGPLVRLLCEPPPLPPPFRQVPNEKKIKSVDQNIN